MQNAIAILLPFLIGVFNKHVASSRAKFWVSIIISVVVGVLLNYTQLSTINWQNGLTFIVYVGLVVGTAQAAYVKYWETHPVYTAMFGESNTAQQINGAVTPNAPTN